MHDARLAALVAFVVDTQAELRQEVTANADDVPERDNALIAYRHATALRKGLEDWIVRRQVRASLKLN